MPSFLHTLLLITSLSPFIGIRKRLVKPPYQLVKSNIYNPIWGNIKAYNLLSTYT